MIEQTSNIRIFDPQRIKFLHVVVTQGSIVTDPEFFENPVQPVRSNIDVSASFGFNTERKLVKVDIRSSFTGISADNQPVGISGRYEIAFSMTVDGFDEFIVKGADGNDMFHHQIAVTMVGIAYSTARGIVVDRTLGTIMGGVFLPVLDANALLVPNEVAPRGPEPTSSAEEAVKKTAKSKPKK